jgi:hypothetical protein
MRRLRRDIARIVAPDTDLQACVLPRGSGLHARSNWADSNRRYRPSFAQEAILERLEVLSALEFLAAGQAEPIEEIDRAILRHVPEFDEALVRL